MSWAAIATAIKARIAAVSPTSVVHEFLRYTREGPDAAEFQSLFVASGIVNVWQVTRVARRAIKSEVDDNRWRIQHDVEVYGHRSLVDSSQSETQFQSLVDSLSNNFRTGDKTLGSTAFTMSDPEGRFIGHSMLAETVLCHSATLAFTVEELA